MKYVFTVLVSTLCYMHQSTCNENHGEKHKPSDDFSLFLPQQQSSKRPKIENSPDTGPFLEDLTPRWNDRRWLYIRYALLHNQRNAFFHEANLIAEKGRALTPQIELLMRRVQELDRQNQQRS
jgi:hypothetical protein